MQRLLTALILLIMLLSSVPARAQTAAMKIVYPDFYPFFSRDSENRMTGIFYEIIKEALEKRMLINVEWENYPWKRCQQNVKNNSADAMVTTINPTRLEYASTHPYPLFIQSVNIFTYKGHERLDELERLKGFNDIHQAGFSIITYLGNGWIEKNAESIGIEVVKVTLRDKIWKMLSLKRGDIVIEWPGGAWPEIMKFKLEDHIQQTNAVINTVHMHLFISKKSPYVNILPGFNKIIEEMDRDGTIQKITEKYCPSPTTLK